MQTRCLGSSSWDQDQLGLPPSNDRDGPFLENTYFVEFNEVGAVESISERDQHDDFLHRQLEAFLSEQHKIPFKRRFTFTDRRLILGTSLQLENPNHVKVLSEFHAVKKVHPVRKVSPGWARTSTSSSDPSPISRSNHHSLSRHRRPLSERRAVAQDTPVLKSSSKIPASWHGTFTSGLLIANAPDRNFTGIVPQAQLAMYRVFGCQPHDTADDLIMYAMQAAFQDGAEILSMSIGRTDGWHGDSPVDQLATRLSDLGMHIVISGGNLGRFGAFQAESPSNTPRVDSVGSVQNNVLQGYTARIKGKRLDKEITYFAANPLTYNETSTFPIYATSSQLDPDNDACTPLLGSVPTLTKFAVLVEQSMSPVCRPPNQRNTVMQKDARVILSYGSAQNAIMSAAEANGKGIQLVALSHEDGIMIKAALNSGKNVSIDFSNPRPKQVVDKMFGGLASNFSQLGPSWDLHFSTLMSAPGGQAFSTLPVALGSYGNSQQAVLRFTPRKFVLAAGASRSVTVTFVPPPPDQLNLPIISGFVVAKSDQPFGSLSVPYLGVAAALNEYPVLQTQQPPGLYHSNGTLMTKDGRIFTLENGDRPELRYWFLMATQHEFTVLVHANTSYVATIPTFPQTPRAGRGCTSATLPAEDYVATVDDSYYLDRSLGQPDIVDYGTSLLTKSATDQAGKQRSIEDGDYRLLLRVLKLQGDPSQESSYQSYLSPMFRIRQKSKKTLPRAPAAVGTMKRVVVS
ncbi:unnamed protein product [Tilletia controversa]|nr:unnamed protein product [Tilletia controversa]